MILWLPVRLQPCHPGIWIDGKLHWKNILKRSRSCWIEQAVPAWPHRQGRQERAGDSHKACTTLLSKSFLPRPPGMLVTLYFVFNPRQIAAGTERSITGVKWRLRVSYQSQDQSVLQLSGIILKHPSEWVDRFSRRFPFSPDQNIKFNEELITI